MTIDLECPHCHTRARVPEQFAGKTGKCNRCGSKVRVPKPELVFESMPLRGNGQANQPPVHWEPPLGDPHPIRPAEVYHEGERVILCDEYRHELGVLHTGTAGTVVSMGLADHGHLRCEMDEGLRSEHVFDISAMILDSLEQGHGDDFLDMGDGVPVRRDPQGGWVMEVGRLVRVSLADGRRLEGILTSAIHRQPLNHSGVVKFRIEDGDELTHDQVAAIRWLNP